MAEVKLPERFDSSRYLPQRKDISNYLPQRQTVTPGLPTRLDVTSLLPQRKELPLPKINEPLYKVTQPAVSQPVEEKSEQPETLTETGLKTGMFDSDNPYEINSLLDVRYYMDLYFRSLPSRIKQPFLRQLVSKYITDKLSTMHPLGPFNTLLVTKAVPSEMSLEPVKEFFKKDLIQPLAIGKPGWTFKDINWKQLALNNFVNFGETADALSNIIKAALPVGMTTAKKHEELKGTNMFDRIKLQSGVMEGSRFKRITYDADVDFDNNPDHRTVPEFIADLGIEILSDPLNIIELGAGIIGKSSAKSFVKNIADQADDFAEEAVEKLSKAHVSDITDMIKVADGKVLDRKVVNNTFREIFGDTKLKITKDIFLASDEGKEAAMKAIRGYIMHRSFTDEAVNKLVKDPTFIQYASDAIWDTITDSSLFKTSYNFTKGLMNMNEVVENVDKLIVTVAGMPVFTPAVWILKNVPKHAVGVVSNLINNYTKAAQAPNVKLGFDIVSYADAESSIKKMHRTINLSDTMKKLTDEDLVEELREAYGKSVMSQISYIHETILDCKVHNMNIEDTIDAIKKAISECTGDSSIKTISDYKQVLELQLQKHPEVFSFLGTDDYRSLIDNLIAYEGKFDILNGLKKVMYDTGFFDDALDAALKGNIDFEHMHFVNFLDYATTELPGLNNSTLLEAYYSRLPIYPQKLYDSFDAQFNTFFKVTEKYKTVLDSLNQILDNLSKNYKGIKFKDAPETIKTAFSSALNNIHIILNNLDSAKTTISKLSKKSKLLPAVPFDDFVKSDSLFDFTDLITLYKNFNTAANPALKLEYYDMLVKISSIKIGEYTSYIAEMLNDITLSVNKYFNETTIFDALLNNKTSAEANEMISKLIDVLSINAYDSKFHKFDIIKTFKEELEEFQNEILNNFKQVEVEDDTALEIISELYKGIENIMDYLKSGKAYDDLSLEELDDVFDNIKRFVDIDLSNYEENLRIHRQSILTPDMNLKPGVTSKSQPEIIKKQADIIKGFINNTSKIFSQHQAVIDTKQAYIQLAKEKFAYTRELISGEVPNRLKELFDPASGIGAIFRTMYDNLNDSDVTKGYIDYVKDYFTKVAFQSYIWEMVSNSLPKDLQIAFMETLERFAMNDFDQFLNSPGTMNRFLRAMQSNYDAVNMSKRVTLDRLRQELLYNEKLQNIVKSITNKSYDDYINEMIHEGHNSAASDVLMTNLFIRSECPEFAKALEKTSSKVWILDIETSTRSSIEAGKNIVSSNPELGMINQIGFGDYHDFKSGLFSISEYPYADPDAINSLRSTGRIIESADELEMLRNLDNALKENGVNMIVFHNGSGFDVPFITSRWKTLDPIGYQNSYLYTLVETPRFENYVIDTLQEYRKEHKLMNISYGNSRMITELLKNISEFASHIPVINGRLYELHPGELKHAVSDLSETLLNVKNLDPGMQNKIMEYLTDLQVSLSNYGNGTAVFGDKTILIDISKAHATDDLIYTMSEKLSPIRKIKDPLTGQIIEEQTSRVDFEKQLRYVIANDSELTQDIVDLYTSGGEIDEFVAKRIDDSFRKRVLYYTLRNEGESFTNFKIRVFGSEDADFKSLQQLLSNETGLKYINYRRIFDPEDFIDTIMNKPMFYIPDSIKDYASVVGLSVRNTNKKINDLLDYKIKDTDAIFNLGLFSSSNGFYNADDPLNLRTLKGFMDTFFQKIQADPKLVERHWLKYLTNYDNIVTPEQYFALFYVLYTEGQTHGYDVYKVFMNQLSEINNLSYNTLNTNINRLVFKRYSQDFMDIMSDLHDPVESFNSSFYSTLDSIKSVERRMEMFESLPGSEAMRIANNSINNKLEPITKRLSSMSKLEQQEYVSNLNDLIIRSADMHTLITMRKALENPEDFVSRVLFSGTGFTFELPDTAGYIQPDVFGNLPKDYEEYTKLVQGILDDSFIDTIKGYGIEVVTPGAGYISFVPSGKASFNPDFINDVIEYNGKTFRRPDPVVVLLDDAAENIPAEDVALYNELIEYSVRTSGSIPYARGMNESLFNNWYADIPREVRNVCIPPSEYIKAGFFETGPKTNASRMSFTGVRTIDAKNTMAANLLENYRYSQNIQPARQAWLDFYFDRKGILNMSADNPNSFVRALGNTEEEINNNLYELCKNNPDMHVVCIVEDNSTQGFHVRRIEIENVHSIEIARRLNASLVPEQVYSTSFDELNNNVYAFTYKGKDYDEFLHNRASEIYHTQPEKLINANGGEPISISQAEYFAHMAYMKKQPQTWLRTMMLVYKLGYLAFPSTAMRNLLDSNFKAMLDTKDPAGILKNQIVAHKYYNDYQKTLKNIYETLNPGENVTTTTINRYFNNVRNTPMTKDAFWFLHSFDVYGPSTGETNRLLKALVENGKPMGNTDKLSKITEVLLTPMQRVERYARLAEYLTLMENGALRSEAFYKVSQTAFDYSVKSNVNKFMEYIFPFFTFQRLNLGYWMNKLTSDPFAVRLLNEVMHVNWDTYDSMYPGEMMTNRSLQYHFFHGSIPLSDEGMVLKLNPSYTDLFNLIADPKDQILGATFAPLQNFFENIFSEKEDMEMQQQLRDGTYIIPFGKYGQNKSDNPLTLNELMETDPLYVQNIVQMPWLGETYPELQQEMLKRLANSEYIIPFGNKLKGQPISILLDENNISYSQWLLGQDWFKDLYKPVYDYLIANKVYANPRMPDWKNSKFANMPIKDLPVWYKSFLLTARDSEGKLWFWESYPRLAEYMITNNVNALLMEPLDATTTLTKPQATGMFASMLFEPEETTGQHIKNILDNTIKDMSTYPIIGVLAQKYIDEHSTGRTSYERLNKQGASNQALLSRIAPGFFGAIKQHEEFVKNDPYVSVKYVSPYQSRFENMDQETLQKNWESKVLYRSRYRYERYDRRYNYYSHRYRSRNRLRKKYRKHLYVGLDVAHLRLGIANLNLV